MQGPRNEGSSQPLDLRQDFCCDQALMSAYARLVGDVFDYAPNRTPKADPLWQVLAYFEPGGRCVAGIEVGDFALVLDGVPDVVSAIRLAGVAASHRGTGLFRRLMEQALRLCDARDPKGATLLYTEDAALYTRFGFVPLEQHAFVGAPPPAKAPVPSAHDLDRADAAASIDRLAPFRASVSRHCAVRSATDLLQASLGDADLRLAVVNALDALLIYEMDDKELVVVDIVARTIPTMGEIVGALRAGRRRIRTLFPPDRLSWDAVPERDETGLMIRGRVPPAMRRPFMLPPTTSF